MSEVLSKTLHGDFDSVFFEVSQPEKVAWITEGQLRLFHLNIRNNKFNLEDMKTLLYRNIGEYVFSRAKIEHFKISGDAFAVGNQALRVLNKNGVADVKGTGAELGEMLLYSFLEEKLKAPKLMSRVELSTDAKGNITTMFCTSTLLEGVNLPADNLFITDNKIFRQQMNPVDFRNLIGRVGRISYNLFGNVFFVSEDKNVTVDNYISMLKQEVPEQSLSIATDPKVLKPVERNVIFVIPWLIVENLRKFINLKFLVLRGMRIIESPLLKGNISADKVKKPADLFLLVLNNVK